MSRVYVDFCEWAYFDFEVPDLYVDIPTNSSSFHSFFIHSKVACEGLTVLKNALCITFLHF